MLSEERKQKNKDNLGKRLKDARTAAGFTQKALAEALDLEYYTMISQMELGYISIPASMWSPIADVLHMDKSEWVLRCLKEYHPDVFRALFENKSLNSVAKLLTDYRKGKI
jgi:transcriptional regulator with XRE-family HTH domain